MLKCGRAGQFNFPLLSKLHEERRNLILSIRKLLPSTVVHSVVLLTLFIFNRILFNYNLLVPTIILLLYDATTAFRYDITKRTKNAMSS